MNSEGCSAYPLKEGSLSPLRKMQRYLSQGEAGEVINTVNRCPTSPRRADYYEVALHS